MLNAKNRLTKRKEFGYIYKHGKYSSNSYITLMYVPTKLKYSRIGFSVNKKIGKAWLRNKVKRQLRDIVRNMINEINPCYNYIFIPKAEITTLDYFAMRDEVKSVLSRAKLLV